MWRICEVKIEGKIRKKGEVKIRRELEVLKNEEFKVNSRQGF